MKRSRETLLTLLTASPGGYVSGERLAAELGCTRAAIWKKIQSLRSSGYIIEGTSQKGYRLLSGAAAWANQLKSDLDKSFDGFYHLFFQEEVSSTNDLAKSAAIAGAKEGSLLLAGRQTAGRGRLGRHWESEAEGGLYFSLLLRPTLTTTRAGLLSLWAGYSIAKAINSFNVDTVGLKWPNDIISAGNGRKIGGILTEAGLEDNQLSYVIIGCGLNVLQQDFPEAIKNRATSLTKEGLTVTQLSLLKAILKEIYQDYKQFTNDPKFFLTAYKELCLTLGKAIEVHSFGEKDPIKGQATDIGEEGELILATASGEVIPCYAGEISLTGNST